MIPNLRATLAASASMLLIIGAIWLYRHGKSTKENEIKIEQLKNQNETKDQIIETKNFQQKLISNPAASDDLDARDEWLRLVWEYTDN